MLNKQVWYKKPIFSVIYEHLVQYGTPINISYAWGFGSLAGITLGIQIVTGLFLAMHYTAHIDFAFASVENIMRNVNFGWLFRYIHANGASMFFIVLYIHMFRGIYYTSYILPRIGAWTTGVVIFLLVMATAFMGYILPWGQMSFWGATVITNLFSAIPFVGESIVLWLWGGFSVDNPTLMRFFIFHFITPFIIAAVVILHFFFLHKNGSGSNIGVSDNVFFMSFYPYFYLKDLFGFFVFILLFSYFVFFNPNYLGHPDNYIPANPLVTPAHIVPEWYFLPFYAILRSIPDKLMGVIAMFASILILFLLPFYYSNKIRNAQYRPLYRVIIWLFVAIFVNLLWIGGNPVEFPYVFIGQVLTVLYFCFFVLILPVLPWVELKLLLYSKKNVHL